MAPDGYVRLRLEDLSAVSFFHLFSESDSDFLQELRTLTIPASAAGFSEWTSNTNPVISLGWGWFIHNQSNQVLLAPDGVRSNVMLVDASGYDLGPLKTSSLFCMWLSAFEWKEIVSTALQETISC